MHGPSSARPVPLMAHHLAYAPLSGQAWVGGAGGGGTVARLAALVLTLAAASGLCLRQLLPPPPTPLCSRTQCGTYSCHGLDEGVDKANQDAACVAHPLQGDPEAALFVVLDGHGDAGSAVSEELLNQLYQHINAHSWGGADSTVDATLNIQKADATLAHQMALAFKRSHDALATFQLDPKTKQPAARESGAAAVVVILRRSRLIVAHAGDCRAVLGRLEPSSKHVAVGEAPGKVKFELTAVELTHDHKLETPEEAARIRSCGGFIRPAMEEPYYAPARVFKDLNKPSKGPGLTMSRSLGDMDADEVGIIPTPEVAFRSIHTEFDQFIVLASDGLWEFLTSEEVVEVVGGFLARGEPAINAARFLIVRAAQQWHREEEGVYRDDITCTVFYLKDLPAGLL
jgi:serine/threonine protein phosphatase PrpC